MDNKSETLRKISKFQGENEHRAILYCFDKCVYCICIAKKNQLDATEWFIALIICSTCFGHFYTHHQELEIICVITAYGVGYLGCWLLEVRFRAAGRPPPDLQQPATKASHTIGGNNTYSLELLIMGTEVPETC